MKEELEKAIEKYPELKHYADCIPSQLWDLFLPSETSEFMAFSATIKALRIREKARDYIMELRKKYGLPLRPNATVEETIKRVRLIRWQRKKRAESGYTEEPGENSSADRIDGDEELI